MPGMAGKAELAQQTQTLLAQMAAAAAVVVAVVLVLLDTITAIRRLAAVLVFTDKAAAELGVQRVRSVT